MRRPGGAVIPAINPRTGFLAVLCLAKYSQAYSSASPPISPNIIIPYVSGSSRNLSITSTNEVPLNGSPPIPTIVDCPNPNLVV